MIRSFQDELRQMMQLIHDDAVIYRDIWMDITPGGGKSSIPIILTPLIPKVADKIAWFVPRRSLAQQAEKTFQNKYLLNLLGGHGQINWSDNTENPSKGTLGFVATYDSVASDPALYRREFARHRYLLFLDEPHHMCADPENTYCKAVRPLLQQAVLRVYASGTWQRGDERPIGHAPYARDIDGILRLNFPDAQTIRYRRIEALYERAVVPLMFDGIDGHAQWKEVSGKTHDVESFDQALASEVGPMLNVVLETEYARALLHKTVRAWQAHKQVWPAAKLLVVAPRQNVAREYARWLWQDFQLRIPIATTDEGVDALRRIQTFKDSKAPEHAALITVGMASEGLDVPTITHLACLTRYRTATWLYQCFARACRNAEGKVAGYVFTPDDTQIRPIIETIKLEQLDTAHEQDTPGGPDGPGGPGITPTLSPIIPLASRLTTNRAYDFEEEMSEVETAEYEALMQEHGVLGYSPLQIKRLINGYQQRSSSPSTPSPPENLDRTPSELRTILRNKIADYERRADHHYWANQWGTTGRERFQRFGKKEIEAFDPDELEEIFSWLTQRYPLDEVGTGNI